MAFHVRRRRSNRRRWAVDGPPRSFLRDHRAATYVEYIIAVGCIALAAVFFFRTFGRQLGTTAAREAECTASLDAGCRGGTPSGAVAATKARESTSIASAGTAASAPSSNGGFVQGAKDVGWGVLAGAWDTAKDVAILAWSALPPIMARDIAQRRPNPVIDGVAAATVFVASASPIGRAVAALGGPDPATRMVNAITRQVGTAWKRNPREFVGRAIGGIAVGYGIGKAFQLARVASVARTAALAEEAEEAVAAASRIERIEAAASGLAERGAVTGPLDGQEVTSLGKNLNSGAGYSNDILVSQARSGRVVAVRLPKDATEMVDFANEARNMKALEAYGGPQYLGKVSVRDASGALREGVAMEVVDGVDMNSIIEETRAPDFPITEKHVQSMEKLFAQLEKDGKFLPDTHGGNFLLTRDGRVVPIDNPVISWDEAAKVLPQHQTAILRDSMRQFEDATLDNVRKLSHRPH